VAGLGRDDDVEKVVALAEFEYAGERVGAPAHRLDQHLLRDQVAARSAPVVFEAAAVIVELEPPAQPFAVGRELDGGDPHAGLLQCHRLDAARPQHQAGEGQQLDRQHHCRAEKQISAAGSAVGAAARNTTAVFPRSRLGAGALHGGATIGRLPLTKL